MSEHGLYVGIDCGGQHHQVYVLDGERKRVGERVVKHNGADLMALVDWLIELGGQAERIAVAIEVPRGPVVETLLERGASCFAINPKQLDRFRDRHSAAGAKDDRRDAWVLADALVTDRAAFRRLRLEEPLVVKLRELSRVDEALTKDRVQLANQLRSQLHRFYPQLLELAPAADQPWVWELFEIAPTPRAGARLRPVKIKRLLRKYHIRKWTPEQVTTCIRQPALRVAPGVTEAASEHAELLERRMVWKARDHAAFRCAASRF